MFKRIFLSLLFLVTAGFLFAQEFSFEKDKIKFKKVDEGQQLSFDFIFVNSGNAPLKIHSADYACSCTSVQLPSKPTPSDEKDTIKVSFDTNLKVGYQQRMVVLYSNAGKKTLEFRGIVKATEATKEKYRQLKRKK